MVAHVSIQTIVLKKELEGEISPLFIMKNTNLEN